MKCLYVDPLLANEICFLLLIFLVALWGLLISGQSEWKSNNVHTIYAYMVDMYVSLVREGRDVGRGVIHYLCVGFGCGFY